MKKANYIFIGVLLLFSVSPLLAVDSGLAQLMAKFAGKTERRAAFVEERYAYYLDSPLKSQGHLKATPPDQLEKIIIEPEAIKQVIRGDSITHSKNGAVVREISLSQQPVLAAAINAMRAVLFGDIAFLQKNFRTHFSNGDNKWKLDLVPRQKTIVKHIKSITVSGAEDTISEFLITEANGDYSKTRLYEDKQ